MTEKKIKIAFPTLEHTDIHIPLLSGEPDSFTYEFEIPVDIVKAYGLGKKIQAESIEITIKEEEPE